MSDAVDPTRVLVFDTTLRDGEQSPGISLNAQEKLEIAQQLARLGVDVIEAGFPITSPGDFEAVREISRNVDGPVICALARTVASDIDRASEAVHDAARPRIHMVIATSDLHIEHKLQTTRQDVLGQARAAVAHAKQYVDDVEFSCEDGFRSDREFMAEVISATIAEGATTINVADTVGYATPEEYASMFTELYERVPALRDVVVSVHCHNDLGVAVANSLAGLQAGCRQVECAINGLGERAGNASLEEIVMLLRTRAPYLGLTTGIDTTEIARTSRLVSRLTGYAVQPNKAIVGRNAFAHESGIHQDGVLKERTTYEIMDAKSIGLEANSIVLGKHSGRHALAQALSELGFEVSGQTLNAAFKRFKEIADKKKQVTAMDLEALVTDELPTRSPDTSLSGSTSRRPRGDLRTRRSACAPPTARRRSGHSPATARSTRSSTRSTPRPESTRGCGSSGSTRSPPARTRSARPRSCSRLTESSDPAKACRPTSLRRPAAHTSARSQTRSAVSTFRPRPKRRPSQRPRPATTAPRLARRTPRGWLPACLRLRNASGASSQMSCSRLKTCLHVAAQLLGGSSRDAVCADRAPDRAPAARLAP
jgi:2-isopropylmalate synthase